MLEEINKGGTDLVYFLRLCNKANSKLKKKSFELYISVVPTEVAASL